MKKLMLLLLVLQNTLLLAQTTAPGLSQNFESNNRTQQGSAYCWAFPGTSFTTSGPIAGSVSGLTGPLSGTTTNGVQTPWALVTGPAQFTFKFRLQARTWERNMRVILQEYKEGLSQSQMPSTVLLSEDYAAGTAPTTTQTRTVSINARGIYRVYLAFYGNGGTARALIDDVVLSGGVAYYGDPANNCLPVTPTPPPTFLDTRLANSDYSLLFEDMWPTLGDFDFNDLVVDYNWLITSNTSDNRVTKAVYTFKLRAMGAGNNNGFGFQLDGIPGSAIASVKGNRITGSLHKFNPNGTEVGPTAATVLVFDQGKALMKNGTSSYVNTEVNAPIIAPVTIKIEVEFSPSASVTLTQLQQAFNPFLVINQNRGKEVHLAGRQPTALATAALFGTGDDNSVGGASRYYRSKENFPWALNIPSSVPYPTERTRLPQAFLQFANWVNTAGAQSADWYENKPNYRVTRLLLQP